MLAKLVNIFCRDLLNVSANQLFGDLKAEVFLFAIPVISKQRRKPWPWSVRALFFLVNVWILISRLYCIFFFTNSFGYTKPFVLTTKNVDLCSCILHLYDLSHKNCNWFYTSKESSFNKFSFPVFLVVMSQLMHAVSSKWLVRFTLN